MVNIITKMRHIGDKIDQVCRVILGILMAVIVLIVVMQLILRPFSMSVRWASELVCLVFVCSVMLGSAVAVKCLFHIGLDSIVNALKGNKKRILQIVSYVFLFIGLFIFTYASAVYAGNTQHTATTMPNLKMSWIYTSLPISGILMIYHSLVQFLELLFLGKISTPQADVDETATAMEVSV